jgi:hypothetical protein
MRIIPLILFWSLLLLSCTEITFPEAQPRHVKPLSEVPPALVGMYQPYSKVDGETGDTLIIESWGYHFKNDKDQDWLGRGVISDSLVVKFYKDYYFVNFREQDQWVLRVVRQKSPGVLEFLSIDLSDESTRKNILNKLGKKFQIKEIGRDESLYYQINPTPAQLVGLIKEGYFTGVELRQIK